MGFLPSGGGGSSGSGVTVDSYVQATSAVTITGTTSGAQTTVVTAAAVTCDGTSVYAVEFYSCDLSISTGAGNFLILSLFDGSTEIGRIATATNPAASAYDTPCYVKIYLTPSAASHTFSVRGYKSGTTVTVGASDGVADDQRPLYIRVTHGG